MTLAWNQRRRLLEGSAVLGALLLMGCAVDTANSRTTGPSGFGGEDVASGQSGNEGSALRLPCFYDAATILVVEVTSTDGGCFAAEVQEVLQDRTRDGLDVGDVVGGVPSLFYTSQEAAVGDTVTIQYYAGQDDTELLSGSAQISTMVGDKIQVEWLGGRYEYTPDELLSDSCDEMFLALPNKLANEEPGGQDPDDAAPPAEPPPLSCPPK